MLSRTAPSEGLNDVHANQPSPTAEVSVKQTKSMNLRHPHNALLYRDGGLLNASHMRAMWAPFADLNVGDPTHFSGTPLNGTAQSAGC
jgi:hypothetical protein